MSKIQMYVKDYLRCLKEQRRCQLVSIIVIILAGILVALLGCNRPVFYKNDVNHPIANGEVDVLCYDTQSLAAVPDVPLDGVVENSNVYTVFTNSKGHFVKTEDNNGHQSRRWPSDCKYVMALDEEFRYEAEAYKYGDDEEKPKIPSYVVYATNWIPSVVKPQNVGDPIIIFDDEDHRLVLFNVVVSIAWQANQTYVKELEAGLRQASGLLYDLTDGQMAFARPSIYLNGSHWNDADIRVLADNDYRPTAYVGGIVREMTPFWADGDKFNFYARHHPGAIFLGRYWDSRTAADGLWSEHNGYSTIVHEWGHYALFLHDEYLNEVHETAYCSCPFAPIATYGPDEICAPSPLAAKELIFSPMYYQYQVDEGFSATEFWHKTNPDTISCEQTVQEFVHGKSDWETLGLWYEIQGVVDELPFAARGLKVPTATPQEGPEKDNQVIYDLARSFIIHDQTSETLNATLSASDQTGLIITNPSETAVAEKETNDFPAQVYVLENVGENGRPQRIIYQGLYPVNREAEKPGQEKFVGIQTSTNRLGISVDQYKTAENEGVRWVYSDPIGTIAGLEDVPITAELIADTWQPSLDITYEVNETSLIAMTVTVTATGDAAPTAQLCVMDIEIGCHADWYKQMTPINGRSNVWQTTIEALGDDELPRYSLIRIHSEGSGEIIRWLQVAGVGPIHGDTDSPTRDGSIVVDTLGKIPIDVDDEIHECYRTIVMPAANYELLQSGVLPESDVQIVGVPLEVDMVMNDPIHEAGEEGPYQCRHFAANEELPVPVVYTLFYDTAQLSDTSSLRVLRFDPGDTPDREDRWIDVSATDVTGLSLKYRTSNSNLSLDINGQFRDFVSFAALNGETIGGVKATVVEGNDGVGVLKLTGPINTFALGSQALFIDDVCPILTSSTIQNLNSRCLDFEDQRLEPPFQVGEEIPTETPILVSSYVDGGEQFDGLAQVVATNENECNCVSGYMLQVTNATLSFDLSQYHSEQTQPQGQTGDAPQIAWISTAPIEHSGIFVLIEVEQQ